MIRANLRDLVAGGVLLGTGLFFGLYSLASYSMGTLRRMGPGMFPVMVGFIIAALGGAIAINALRSQGALPRPDFKAVAGITAGIALFALMAKGLGLVPAIFVLTICSAFAGARRGWREVALLAGCLSILATVIFVFGLGVSLDIAPGF